MSTARRAGLTTSASKESRKGLSVHPGQLLIHHLAAVAHTPTLYQLDCRLTKHTCIGRSASICASQHDPSQVPSTPETSRTNLLHWPCIREHQPLLAHHNQHLSSSPVSGTRSSRKDTPALIQELKIFARLIRRNEAIRAASVKTQVQKRHRRQAQRWNTIRPSSNEPPEVLAGSLFSFRYTCKACAS